MPIVEIPNVGNVEFPDSMSAADIDATIRTKILPQATEAKKQAIAKQYDALANTAANQAPPSNWSLGGALDAVGGAAKGAIQTLLPQPALDPQGNIISGSDIDQQMQATRRQAQLAQQNWQYGEPVAAAGHGLAAALPYAGPAAAGAGEDIYNRQYSRGLTGAALMVGPEALRGARAIGVKTPNAVVEAIRAEGPNDLLAQTTKRGKTLLERQGQKVQEAGLGGTKQEVLANTGKTLQEVGPQIPVEEAKVAGIPDVQAMHDRIQALRDQRTVNGVPLNDAYDNRLAKAQEQLLDISTAPNETVNYVKLAKLKDEWQKEAKASYTSPDVKAAGQGIKGAAAVINDVLRDTEGAEAINKLNDIYSANKAANDLASLARPKAPMLVKVGSKVAAGLAGTAVGHLLGEPIGGAATALMIEPTLREAIMSGGLRKAPAAIRNSIADAIASGDKPAQRRFAQIASKLPARSSDQ